ncbi:MAG: ATP-binding protein [Bacteroidales bacterium]|nr:ATP-binding protein [Bacteroidales bacterium]
MSIYVNPNNDYFAEVVNSTIYVDKSMLIEKVNSKISTLEKYLCVSRPRRFGKSIAAGMLVAYYSKGCDSKELFSSLKICQADSFGKHLNKHNVIYLDLNGFFREDEPEADIFSTIRNAVIGELRMEFPSVDLSNAEKINEAIQIIYNQIGEKFIFIMDEYDVLIRRKAPDKIITSYLSFLESLFKNSAIRPAIEIAYLTGILPIVRDTIQSKMNEFDEYSFLNSAELAEFAGITYDETEDLCRKFNVDFDKCKRWYDGYIVNGIEIFAPKSVVKAISSKVFESHWGKTGSYEAVSDYVNLNFDGIYDDIVKMLSNEEVHVDVSTYLNTMTDFTSKDDVFTYLIHIGYLGYNADTESCFVPNYEVRKEWGSAMRKASNFKAIGDRVAQAEELLRRTIACDEEYVAQALNDAHRSICHPLKYNNESAFQNAMVIAYYTAPAKYYVIQELPSGEGFADIALIPHVPNVPAIIIELKVNGSKGLAISQIKDRKYDEVLKYFQGDLLFVGVNYDKESKVHTCKIEKVVR